MDKNKINSTITPYVLKEIRKIKLNKDSKILDVGCGIGQYFPFMKGDIYGIDFDAKNIEKAKKLFPKAKLISYDLTKSNIPFKQKFDLIICLEVIEHMSKKRAAVLIKELEKLAKGDLLISTPNINNFTSLLRFAFFRNISIAGKPNFFEKIIFLLQHKRFPPVNNKYFVMDETDEYANKGLHYHMSSFSSRDLSNMGFKVIGGLGFIVERKIKSKKLKQIFEKIYYFFPYFSGSILGIKKFYE